jgi:hypothetical protein
VRDEENENPIDTPNSPKAGDDTSSENASWGRGGNESAHLHTPTHGVENGGSALHTAHPLHTPDEAADFLAAPPDWLRVQADKHLENPTERTLNPLCSAVAAHLYGDPARRREVKPAVADWLGKVSA